MGGQVPAQDMTGERLQLLAEAMILVETPDRDKWPARKEVRGLIERLVHAAERGPRAIVEIEELGLVLCLHADRCSVAASFCPHEVRN